MSDVSDKLSAFLIRLQQKQTAKLEALADAADALLLETSKAKGMEFAFKEAMWGTWSMERFGKYFCGKAIPY